MKGTVLSKPLVSNMQPAPPYIVAQSSHSASFLTGAPIVDGGSKQPSQQRAQSPKPSCARPIVTTRAAGAGAGGKHRPRLDDSDESSKPSMSQRIVSGVAAATVFLQGAVAPFAAVADGEYMSSSSSSSDSESDTELVAVAGSAEDLYSATKSRLLDSDSLGKAWVGAGLGKLISA